MINPGTIKFRKHCEQVLPLRAGEPKAQYIERLARHFGIPPSRMTVLYYDSRRDNARFTTTEYEKILRSTPQSGDISKTPHLYELKTKLEEQDKNISRLERELARQGEFKRKLGELLASH